MFVVCVSVYLCVCGVCVYGSLGLYIVCAHVCACIVCVHVYAHVCEVFVHEPAYVIGGGAEECMYTCVQAIECLLQLLATLLFRQHVLLTLKLL